MLLKLAVLLKEDIVLNYFVTSINHKMFALADLKDGETIEQLRDGEGSHDMFLFEVDAIIAL